MGMMRRPWAVIMTITAVFMAANPASAKTAEKTVSAEAPAAAGPVESVFRFISSVFFGTRPERAVYHVSPTGSVFGDGSEKSPWSSLKWAAAYLRAGDTLIVAEGTYREGTDLAASGREDAWITIEGVGKVVIDGSTLYKYNPAFDTHDHSFIRFKNFTVVNARAAVQVKGGHHVVIEDFTVDHSQFAVNLRNASFVTIRNVTATHSRNAFRGDGRTHDILIENAAGLYSQDRYEGYNPDYLNGDGFIFENRTHDITIRDSVGGDNWDSGFDIKARDAHLENVVAYGNKNGLKLWGKNITVKNALVVGQKSQPRPEKESVDGMGVNVRRGFARVTNATFADNEGEDVKVAKDGRLRLENSIVARRGSGGKLLGAYGRFEEDRVWWFREGTDAPDFEIAEGSVWADPEFEDRENGNFRSRAAPESGFREFREAGDPE